MALNKIFTDKDGDVILVKTTTDLGVKLSPSGDALYVEAYPHHGAYLTVSDAATLHAILGNWLRKRERRVGRASRRGNGLGRRKRDA